MAEVPFASLLQTAHALADLSAAQIMPHFREPLDVANKAGGASFDPVTAADRAAEQVIREELARALPSHGIVGEEFDNAHADSPYRWIIDPIDGTRAFIMGLPLWGTLIGLTYDAKPILGMMNQPYTGERFWTSESQSFLTGPRGKRRLATRRCRTLAEAVFSTTHPDMFMTDDEVDRFSKLKSSVRMTRFGGDCYGYCMLAMGYIDVIVESQLKPYDIAALVPIIERAGGRITGWKGEDPLSSSRVVAAGDPALHEQVLRLFA